MAKTKKYKSDVKAAIHEIANSLHGIGMIDKQTMRRFDDSCLTPIHEFSADEIRGAAQREDVSQSVFASYLSRANTGAVDQGADRARLHRIQGFLHVRRVHRVADFSHARHLRWHAYSRRGRSAVFRQDGRPRENPQQWDREGVACPANAPEPA